MLQVDPAKVAGPLETAFQVNLSIFIYLSFYLSICLSISLSPHLSIYLSIFLSIYLSIFLIIDHIYPTTIYPSKYLSLSIFIQDIVGQSFLLGLSYLAFHYIQHIIWTSAPRSNRHNTQSCNKGHREGKVICKGRFAPKKQPTQSI